MFQCERCCEMINNVICPNCKYDNTEYIKQHNLSIDEKPNSAKKIQEKIHMNIMKK